MADKTDDLILSISSDTAPLKRALRILGQEVDRFSKDAISKFEKAGAGIDTSMTTAMQTRINAMVGLGTKASKEWSGALAKQGTELEKLRTKYNPVFAAIKQYQASVVSIQQAHRLGAISADEMTSAIQRERKATLDSIAAIKQRNSAIASMQSMNAGPNRFNTANIAAQFQDIAVTNAMGMSPIQIALQQGTQLSAVLNEMGKGRDVVRGIGAAFASIVSPVSLVTIGIIAASSALYQYAASANSVKSIDELLEENRKKIDEITEGYKEAKRAYEAYVQAKGIKSTDDAEAGLETQLKTLSERYVVAQKEAASYQQSLQGFARSSLSAEVIKQANALFELAKAAGETGADMSAISASLTKMINQGFAAEELKRWAKELKGVVSGASDLQIEIGGIRAAMAEISEVTKAFSDLEASINGITSDKARDEVQKLYDRFKDGKTGVEDLRKALGDLSANSPDLQKHVLEILRLAEAADLARKSINDIWKGAGGKGDRNPGLNPLEFNDRFGGNQDAIDQLKNQRKDLERQPKRSAAERKAERDANAYRDLVKSAQDRIDQLKLEEQLVGKTGVAAETMRMKLELLQKAQDKGRSVSEAQRAEIDKLATAYGRAAEKVSAMQMVEELQFERAQMFRSPTEQKVYGSLRSAGINPDSEYGQAIGNQIRLNEQLAIGRERALDFAQGLANDIMNSADAVDILRNSVSRLAQMLIEMGTNSAINGFFANFGGGLGGGSFTPTTTLGNFLKGIPGFAGGTDNAPPGFAWVGEKGPELVRFGGGEQVIPNDILRSMANRSVSGPRVPNVPSAANSASQTGVHVTLGWSSDSDGNIAPIIKSVAQREVKTGLTAYDKGSAVRLGPNLRQVNQRGYAK